MVINPSVEDIFKRHEGLTLSPELSEGMQLAIQRVLEQVVKNGVEYGKRLQLDAGNQEAQADPADTVQDVDHKDLS